MYMESRHCIQWAMLCPILLINNDAATLNEFPNFITGEKLEMINDITTVGTSEPSKIVTLLLMVKLHCLMM